MLRVIIDFQAAHRRAYLAVTQIQVSLFHVIKLPVAPLGGEQHGQRAVLIWLDGRNRVHDNTEFDRHVAMFNIMLVEYGGTN